MLLANQASIITRLHISQSTEYTFHPRGWKTLLRFLVFFILFVSKCIMLIMAIILWIYVNIPRRGRLMAQPRWALR